MSSARARATQRILSLAVLAVALTILAALTVTNQTRAGQAAPPAQSHADHTFVTISSTAAELTVCRGTHVDGRVVVRHVSVAECPNSTYYKYDANVWALPRDGMLTCNGNNSHGDPPAPYVVTRLGTDSQCSSYVGEVVQTYYVQLPREGTAVCTAQRELPDGWVVTRYAFTQECYDHRSTASNTMYVTNTKPTLTRYRSGTGDHASALRPPAGGYLAEGGLGRLSATAQAGTRPVYQCRVDTDYFTSVQANCEGRSSLGVLGYIYLAAPAAPFTVLRRCMVTATGEHFDSTTSDCEGQTPELIIGYLI